MTIVAHECFDFMSDSKRSIRADNSSPISLLPCLGEPAYWPLMLLFCDFSIVNEADEPPCLWIASQITQTGQVLLAQIAARFLDVARRRPAWRNPPQRRDR